MTTSEFPMTGAVSIVPYYAVYPSCIWCTVPGKICEICGQSFCPTCHPVCGRDYDDSPWQSEAEDVEEKTPGDTGGSFQIYELEYGGLRQLYMCPKVWLPYEEGLYLRCEILTELNTCYVIDDGKATPFGTRSSDFKKLYEAMWWHHEFLAIVNMYEKKAFLIDGEKPKEVDLKHCLRLLRSSATGFGILAYQEAHDPRFALLESTMFPEDKAQRKCNLRDKITMGVLKSQSHVEFWRS